MLEEAVPLIRSLLTNERTTFDGRYFRTEDASCLPLPVQDRLPIWVGGTGERRTMRIAARYADGWNAAYTTPSEYGRLCRVLDGWCEKEGRDPSTIRRTINLIFLASADAAGAARVDQQLEAQWGELAGRVKGGAVTGLPAQVVEQVAAYVRAGAQGVNIALRAPWDEAALDAYLGEVVPAVRAEFGGT
jgi:alkanesulfonate monooxygenase SsuD/methylene tetrahydromethanopterin reductase-like flavin-dependent oxidoreductase (luciferase family)